MVEFNEKTPRQDITIGKDYTYSIPLPFEEGHIVSANEAVALNQLLKENVRNNIAAKNKARSEYKDEAGNPAPIAAFTQEEFDAYVAGYEFGARPVGTSVKYDSVTKVARKAIENAIIKKTNKPKKEWDAEVLEETITKVFESNKDLYIEKAKAVIAAQEAAANIALD